MQVCLRPLSATLKAYKITFLRGVATLGLEVEGSVVRPEVFFMRSKMHQNSLSARTPPSTRLSSISPNLILPIFISPNRISPNFISTNPISPNLFF